MAVQFSPHLRFAAVLEQDLGRVKQELGETELFPAVRMGGVQEIRECVQKKKMDVNALDCCDRNAMQAALQRAMLSVEACQALIEMGIDLNHTGTANDSALAHLVRFYEFGESAKPLELELFRCLVEAGAKVDVTHKDISGNQISVREKIRSYPEMEAIVQAVQGIHVKRAREVYRVLEGDPHITRIVCQMIGCDPGPFWQPPVCADPRPRKYGAPVPCKSLMPPLP